MGRGRTVDFRLFVQAVVYPDAGFASGRAKVQLLTERAALLRVMTETLDPVGDDHKMKRKASGTAEGVLVSQEQLGNHYPLEDGLSEMSNVFRHFTSIRPLVAERLGNPVNTRKFHDWMDFVRLTFLFPGSV